MLTLDMIVMKEGDVVSVHSLDLRYQLENVIEDEYNKFYAVIYRITGTHQDTEDVLQNSFLKAFINIDKFKGKSNLSTWLYRIAINESYSYMKTWKKLPVVSIIEENNITDDLFYKQFKNEPSIDDELIIEEIREQCIRGFLKCMPKQRRVVFILKTSLDLKNKEIAEILEISESYAKVQLYRARKQLQEMFEYRCSLIDPSKPCKCHFWIKYMRDNNLPIPDGHHQIKNNTLHSEYFKKMESIKKIAYLYQVENTMNKEAFIKKIKKSIEIL